MQGFDIAGKMIAARTVGGNYFDYIELRSIWAMSVRIADRIGRGR